MYAKFLHFLHGTGVRSITTGLRCGLLLGSIMLGFATPASAQSLKACVVGKDGQPKAFVNLEIHAARMQFAKTAADGCFTIDISNGTYVVRVRENRRRQDFSVRVPAESSGKILRVNW